MSRTELLTILIAALPVVELRGALPFAIVNGLSVFKGYVLSIVGNMLPVIPLFFAFDFFFRKLKYSKLVGKYLEWWFTQIEKKAKIVSVYGWLALIVFVAIPLPTTGVWTGTLVGRLLNFTIFKVFLAMLCGVLVSGIIVSVFSLGTIKIGSIL